MLLARVVVRARSMELLARESGLDRSAQDLAFMAGMFSLLGVLFGSPLSRADSNHCNSAMSWLRRIIESVSKARLASCCS
jgi:hypothetical protein